MKILFNGVVLVFLKILEINRGEEIGLVTFTNMVDLNLSVDK